MYISKFTSDALEDIKSLPKNVKNALKKQFEEVIHRNPDCSDPLEGQLAGFRSFHFEEYRVVYKVFEDLRGIAVVGVGKKDKDSRYSALYQKLEALATSGKLADTVLQTMRLFSYPR